MDDKLRLAISIDKTFIVIVEIHLKTVLRKTYHVSISYRSVTWKISDFYLTLFINNISPLYYVSDWLSGLSWRRNFWWMGFGIWRTGMRWDCDGMRNSNLVERGQ